MTDLSFSFGSFADTTIKVEAGTPKGREFLASMFGPGAVAIDLPKSRGEDFASFAQRKGLSTN